MLLAPDAGIHNGEDGDEVQVEEMEEEKKRNEGGDRERKLQLETVEDYTSPSSTNSSWITSTQLFRIMLSVCKVLVISCLHNNGLLSSGVVQMCGARDQMRGNEQRC